MKLNARDVIYYPYRLFENSNTPLQEAGEFFLESICSHLVIPKKCTDPKTKKEWTFLQTIPMSTCNLNASDLACTPEEGDINIDYVGEMELDARKVGELVKQYRCKFDVPKYQKLPPTFNFSALNVLDVFSDWGVTSDPVTSETYYKRMFWAVVSLKHQACVRDIMFCDIARDEKGYNLDHAEVEYLDGLKAKGLLKYFKDFNVVDCTFEGKFSPVWRVKLMI